MHSIATICLRYTFFVARQCIDFKNAEHESIAPVANWNRRAMPTNQLGDVESDTSGVLSLFDRDEPLHLSIIARHPRVCARALLGIPQ